MPTLPLFTPIPENVDPACSRRVIAPGGYEWWRFDVLDAERQLLLVAEWFTGDALDDAYLRAFGRYLRRPTIHRPPNPRDFAGFAMTVYRAGQAIAESTLSHQPIEAAPDRLDLRIGPASVQRREDGSIALSAGPAQVVLRPRHALPSRAFSADQHHCVIFAPIYEAEGLIAAGGDRLTIGGAACGYYLFGTSPLRRTVRRWRCLRALSRDHAEIAVRFQQGGREKGWSVVATGDGWHEGASIAEPERSEMLPLTARRALRRSCSLSRSLIADEIAP